MDPFDAMLRERLARLLAAAPQEPARPPQLTASSVRDGLGHAWKVGADRVRPGRGPWPVAAVLGAVAVVIVLLAGAAGLVPNLTDRRSSAAVVPSAGPSVAAVEPIVWASDFARLRADSLRIETDGKVFTAAGIEPDSVRSGSGSKRGGTLAVIWHEQGVEMRMNIYFAADDKEWWVSEIRVYDGREPGEWIGWGGGFSTPQDGRSPQPVTRDVIDSRLRALGVPADAEVLALGWAAEGYVHDVVYRDSDGQRHQITCDRREVQAGCPSPLPDLGLFRSPLGEAWTGDLDLVDGVGLEGVDRQVSGELHIRGLRLSAFR